MTFNSQSVTKRLGVLDCLGFMYPKKQRTMSILGIIMDIISQMTSFITKSTPDLGQEAFLTTEWARHNELWLPPCNVIKTAPISSLFCE